MSAVVIILPIVRIERYTADGDLVVENADSRLARCEQVRLPRSPPPRSRPVLKIDNERNGR